MNKRPTQREEAIKNVLKKTNFHAFFQMFSILA